MAWNGPKDPPKSKHMDSTCLRPTSSSSPAWLRREISMTASTGLSSAIPAAIPEGLSYPGCFGENTMGRVLPSGGELEASKH